MAKDVMNTEKTSDMAIQRGENEVKELLVWKESQHQQARSYNSL